MSVRSVTSANNPRLKEAARLLRSAHERRKSRLCVLEGEHLIEMYATRHGTPRTLIATEAFCRHPLVVRCRNAADVYIVDNALFSETATLPPAVGMLAVVPIPEPVSSTSVNSGTFHLMLDDVQDPGNVGAMMRTAAAAGVGNIVLSKNSVSAWSPKVLRAAQGAHFLLEIIEDADVAVWAERFQAQGGKIAAAVPRDGVDLYRADFAKSPLALAVGNEGGGLGRALLAKADWRLTIPMPGAMESLNVAAAAAVILFECVRRRQAR